MSDPDEDFDRGADDLGTDERGLGDRYGSRVAQVSPKKKRKKNEKAKEEKKEEEDEADPPIIEVTPEDRSKQPPRKAEHDMDLGKKLPDLPPISDRDLLRARVVNYPIVRVEVIDLPGVVSWMWKSVGSSIEKRVNEVTKRAGDVHVDVTQHVTIATYRKSEPSKKEKSGQLPLDFPVYFVPRARNRPDTDKDASKMLRRIMTEYGAKKRATDESLSGWTGTSLRGVTCAPIGTLHTVVFMNTDQLLEEASSDATFFANETLHELGHALGVFRGKSAHPNDGSLMQPRKQSGNSLGHYSDAHCKSITIWIKMLWNAELKQLSPP